MAQWSPLQGLYLQDPGDAFEKRLDRPREPGQPNPYRVLDREPSVPNGPNRNRTARRLGNRSSESHVRIPHFV